MRLNLDTFRLVLNKTAGVGAPSLTTVSTIYQCSLWTAEMSDQLSWGIPGDGYVQAHPVTGTK